MDVIPIKIWKLDILVNGAGIIIEDISSERLCKVLQRLTPGELKEMNQKIVAEQFIMQIEDMEEQIEKICYGWWWRSETFWSEERNTYLWN